MADLKGTQLPEDTTPNNDDIYYVVKDPSGTPTSKKTKLSTLKTNLAHYSNGSCQISSIADLGNGSVTIGNGNYCLSNNVAGEGYITQYAITGNTFVLTDNAINYIVANYNSGTPIIEVITDVTLINETTIVPIYTIFRNGIYLHIQNWDSLATALVNKIHQSIVKTQRYRRQSGLALSESGTRNLNLTTGIIWTGAVPITLDAIATATDNMFLWYHVGGVWTQSIIAQYNNTQYDNGTDLVTLSNGKYAVSWVFRGVESGKHLYIILGGGDYTLAEAQEAVLGGIPNAISSHAVLVGKVIVAKSAATATSIQSAFDTQFSTATPNSHNDLVGIQGGVAGEYYHLTSAQLTLLGNQSGTNSGNETATTIGALINGATAKTTPVDADMVGLMDSAASNVVKKLSWANIKATLKTYFDTVYAQLAGSISQAFSVSQLEVGHATDTSITRVSAGKIAVEGVNVVTTSSTDTLTNKRINQRLVTATSYTTDTGTSLDVSTCDQFEVTAQAGALKLNNPGGTPLGGQKLIVRIKDNGTARALTYDTQFRALGNALPSTTVLSKTLYLGFIYNATDTKWDLVATAQEA